MTRASPWILAVMLCSSGCGPGPCPDASIVSADAEAPGLVQILVDLRCAGEPVGALPRSAFRLTENDRDATMVERWNHIRTTDGAGTFSQILVDVSETTRAVDGGVEAIAEAARAASELLAVDGQLVSVAAYDGEEDLDVLSDFSTDPEAHAAALEALLTRDPRDPSTNLFGALREASGRLTDALEGQQGARGLPGVANILLFASGPDRAGRVTATRARNWLRSSEVQLFAATVDDEELTAQIEEVDAALHLTSSGLDGLADPADDAAAEVIRHADSFVTISYCSPLRREQARLEITVTVEDRDDTIHHTYATKAFGVGCVLPEPQ